MKKVCLLTGASGKLGTAFCRLHADKYHIVGVYRRRHPDVASQLQSFVNPLSPEKTLEENEHPIYAVQAELTDDRELERVVELALARYDRIDLLVNAAVHSVWSPILDSPRLLESAGTQFNTNVIIPLKLAALVARMFWRDREEENLKFNRNVVNVSSMAGVRVYRGVGQSVYSASKAALNQLTYHLADEFKAFGVRVNATAPNAFPRIVSTESVAQTIVRLDSGLLSGKILVLDSDGVRFV
ncbi:MAG TPA: SDR family oxidoreductase [Pyrinomonadaceae bacterium]|nr:SDR family oxidoreductase [Pyrinomonadaceae bacterium]